MARFTLVKLGCGMCNRMKGTLDAAAFIAKAHAIADTHGLIAT